MGGGGNKIIRVDARLFAFLARIVRRNWLRFIRRQMYLQIQRMKIITRLSTWKHRHVGQGWLLMTQVEAEKL